MVAGYDELLATSEEYRILRMERETIAQTMLKLDGLGGRGNHAALALLYVSRPPLGPSLPRPHRRLRAPPRILDFL
jgi:hypothetical protein